MATPKKQQRGPAVSKEHFRKGAERERAIARKPGMVLTRFGKTGHPVAVDARKLAEAKAGRIRLHEDGTYSVTPKGRATRAK